jgi:N-acetyl sugar amidotransferase
MTMPTSTDLRAATKVRYCRTCLMPDTRPRIVFNEDGICNACLTAAEKRTIDWDARLAEFRRLFEANKPKNSAYDCVVPWSGGKDSSSIAYKLKFEHGLNPLLVTFSPLIPNEVGEHNREALLRAGFDHVMVRPNQKVASHLARRFFVERGNPKVHWDAGVNSAPVQVAVRFGIPLIFYAEHGESEYGGRVLSEEHRKIRDITEVLEHQIGDHPENWLDDVVGDRDLAPYIYPDLQEVERVGVKAMYFAWFFPWDVMENYNYIASKIDFHTAASGRSDGTFTNFDSLDDKIDNLYYYMQFIKFGFGRATRDASRQIYRGRMTRDEALELVRKYDDEFPHTAHAETLDYLQMSEREFEEIVDLHRNAEIWEMSGNGWRLRFPAE